MARNDLPPRPGLAKRRSRRLLKKLRLAEFQQRGFDLRFIFKPGVSPAEETAFWGAFLAEAIDANGLLFCGGAEGFVYRAGRASCTSKDRFAVAMWLCRHPEVCNEHVGRLVDVWYEEPDPPCAMDISAIERRLEAFSALIGVETYWFVCHACGYPLLEEMPEEIWQGGCPLCGWHAYFDIQPLERDREEVAHLCAVARCHVAHHGDVHPRWLLHDGWDHERAWFRRPDVSALRAEVKKRFDAWLADPGRTPEMLPSRSWAKLDWSEKDVEKPLLDLPWMREDGTDQ